ncbi:hypothetical protein [Pectinatus haikarae]|uniref:Uncharacterized protein n=1 Tax=Pectinatus haikarae TaxID=349096 RepID=A0ABT9Y3Z2_9FIRM|nr:hypothetical protein [Pectinatus haikarae]MDQ0202464.1 hypothetical protein [Pectinatus haikarae]
MSKWARVANEVVQEITDVSPVGRFTADIVAQFIECDDTVQQGYTYADSKFAVPTVTLTKQQKLDALDTEYNPQFDQLVNSLGVATLADDEDAQASIKADYTVLKTEYTTKRTAIEDGTD